MPSFRTIFFTVGTTMLTMFVLNQAAGIFPLARRVIRGQSVSAVPATESFTLAGSFPGGTFT